VFTGSAQIGVGNRTGRTHGLDKCRGVSLLSRGNVLSSHAKQYGRPPQSTSSPSSALDRPHGEPSVEKRQSSL